MRRLIRSSLLALALGAGLVAPAASASPGAMSTLLEQIAAASPSRVAELIASRRKAVNESLAQRARRYEDYRRAQARRDRMARKIEQMKRSGDSGTALKGALQEALVLDEEAQVARSALLAAEAEVSKTGAELLQVYDAVLTERRQAIASVSRGSSNQERLVAAYRKLASQRDQVRSVLKPILQPRGAEGASLREIAPQPDDDVETLLEKADLARDLEERYLRQAEQVRKRIIELEAEQALARDVIGMARTESLFDENDRRLLIERTGGLLSGPQRSNSLLVGATTANAAGGAPPPSSDQDMGPVASPGGSENERSSGDDQGDLGVSEPDGAAGEEVTDSDDFAGGMDPSPAPSADPDPVDTDGDGSGFEPNTGNGAVDAPSGEGSPTLVGGRGVQTPTMPETASVTEQAFLGPRPMSDAEIADLLGGDALSLSDLKRVERALRLRAKSIESEEKRIRRSLESSNRRR